MNRVRCMYFSPTGTTQRIAERIGEGLSKNRAIFTGEEVVWDLLNFTPPQSRMLEEVPRRFCFTEGEVVILALPVYAGRLPNLLLPFLRSLRGNGALGIPVVVYGNRSFDDALRELKELMEEGGFRVMAAGAFVGRHSFSDYIAGMRPDIKDLHRADDFAAEIAQKWNGGEKGNGIWSRHEKGELSGGGWSLNIPGRASAERGYYQPKNEQGEPMDFRKIKPQTGERCTGCAQCAAVCPMGAISPEEPRKMIGICIKCCACVRICPVQAKHFTDKGFLYHIWELEQTLVHRQEPVFFI